MDLKYENLTQPLVEHASNQPDRSAVILLHGDGSEENITAKEFHQQAEAHSRALARVGVQSDDLVVLVLRHSSTLLYAFWGAIYLGAVASIFPYLTEKLDPNIYMHRVKTLVKRSRARFVITYPEFQADLAAALADVECRVLNSDELTQLPKRHNTPTPEMAAPEKTAFLQHSSGTTGLQKGVALTHRSVLNQVQAYSSALELNADDVIVSWLPLYHDMGLIAGFIMPLVAGVPLVLMSPFTWVRRPAMFLQAIHRHRGTLCWLPNFAYNHMAHGVREREISGVRLDSLRGVINCSEPVRYDSHCLFIARFRNHGLRARALATSYAMAENTFAVTQSQLGHMPRVDWVQAGPLRESGLAIPAGRRMKGSTPLVSSGLPIGDVEIQIVDEHGDPLPERRVGEIALRGSSLFRGYYRRPKLTTTSMQDSWFLSGDLGYTADGHLFVCGRKKDQIIVGGKNIFPQDLEAIANSTAGIHPGRCVAFGLENPSSGTEMIVMVCELINEHASQGEREEIERELRRRISRETEITLDRVYLAPRRWLLKTSSGKIARQDNARKYVSEMGL